MGAILLALDPSAFGVRRQYMERWSFFMIHLDCLRRFGDWLQLLASEHATVDTDVTLKLTEKISATLTN